MKVLKLLLPLSSCGYFAEVLVKIYDCIKEDLVALTDALKSIYITSNQLIEAILTDTALVFPRSCFKVYVTSNQLIETIDRYSPRLPVQLLQCLCYQ